MYGVVSGVASLGNEYHVSTILKSKSAPLVKAGTTAATLATSYLHFQKKKSKRINVEVSARSSEYGLVDSMELQILSVFSLAADPETLVQL